MEMSIGVNKDNEACKGCFFMRGMVKTADGLEPDIRPDASDWREAFAYCHIALLHKSSDVEQTRKYVTNKHGIPDHCPNEKVYRCFKIV